MPTLAELQNPYASLNLYFDVEEDLEKHAYVKKQQNPWAALEVFGESKPDPSNGSGEPPYQGLLHLAVISQQPFVSKAVFRNDCRVILRQYEPLGGRNRLLRQEFRNFIKINVEKTGASRSAILDELARFDLSSMGTLNPQLNREGDTLLQKLEKISRKYPA